jgi:hypothetical protein
MQEPVIERTDRFLHSREMNIEPEPEPHEYSETVKCIGESRYALQLRVEGTGRKFWVPKSVVHDDSEVFEEGQEGRLVLHSWFAEKEGLE